jgi:hypothetical protein
MTIRRKSWTQCCSSNSHRTISRRRAARSSRPASNRPPASLQPAVLRNSCFLDNVCPSTASGSGCRFICLFRHGTVENSFNIKIKRPPESPSGRRRFLKPLSRGEGPCASSLYRLNQFICIPTSGPRFPECMAWPRSAAIDLHRAAVAGAQRQRSDITIHHRVQSFFIHESSYA